MSPSLSLLLLAAAVCLSVGPRASDAFLRIMGNSDTYCGYEGAYCYSDTICCGGLVCRYGYKRYGGICEREQPNYAQYELPPTLECQSDTDCPGNQCCLASSIGIRGATIRSCQERCPNKDVDTILSDFYNRYYRSNRRKRGAN